MKLAFTALAVLSLFIGSCNTTEGKAEAPSTEPQPLIETYRIDVDSLTGNFQRWYNYTYYNVRIEQDFIGLDKDSNKIDKRQFLNALAGGGAVAYKVAKENNTPVYKLYKAANLDADIRGTSTDAAQTAIKHLDMEGTGLPAYDFTDLQGNRYTPGSTKGKLLVVKCWYINCFKCVQEFPVLNSLVNQYKDRTDIAFVSLASDPAKDLQAFLKKKPFNYAVVPAMDDYMTNKLAVTAYPLHLLINREGKIVKVTNNIEDLIPTLKKEMNITWISPGS